MTLPVSNQKIFEFLRRLSAFGYNPAHIPILEITQSSVQEQIFAPK
jgi:hypothetical protein